MDDIHHLNARIRKYQADAQQARQLAETERGRADQYRGDPDDGKMRYHEHEAEKQDAHAIEFEEEMYEAQDAKQDLEGRIEAMERERDELMHDSRHNNSSRVKRIQGDIDRLRGTSFSL